MFRIRGCANDPWSEQKVRKQAGMWPLALRKEPPGRSHLQLEPFVLKIRPTEDSSPFTHFSSRPKKQATKKFANMTWKTPKNQFALNLHGCCSSSFPLSNPNIPFDFRMPTLGPEGKLLFFLKNLEGGKNGTEAARAEGKKLSLALWFTTCLVYRRKKFFTTKTALKVVKERL